LTQTAHCSRAASCGDSSIGHGELVGERLARRSAFDAISASPFFALSYANAGCTRTAIGAAPRDDRADEAAARMSLDLDLVQWPAMLVTVVASWLVGSKDERRRNIGFWVFMLSNALWIVWGSHAGATALIVLQVCLAAMNIRGAMKNDK
jgi:hypothetical protein